MNLDNKTNTISSSKIKISNVSELPESIQKAIDKAKRNIFVSKNWNKRADNKILKLYNEDGLEVTLHILKILYGNLKTDISKTLVAYINGILKNIKKDKELLDEIRAENKLETTKKSLKEDVKEIEDAVIVEENIEKVSKNLREKEASKEEIIDPIDKILLELYEKMDVKEKDELLEKAKNMFIKESKIKNYTPLHEKIFNSTKKIYLLKILKIEKGL